MRSTATFYFLIYSIRVSIVLPSEDPDSLNEVPVPPVVVHGETVISSFIKQVDSIFFFASDDELCQEDCYLVG